MVGIGYHYWTFPEGLKKPGAAGRHLKKSTLKGASYAIASGELWT
jgi:hypothetical protein